MLLVVFLAVATVSARRISDHPLSQPKADFGTLGDIRVDDFGDSDVKNNRGSDNGDRNVKTEFSSRSFGERHKPGNPEFHEFSNFNTHFKHHHFRQSSNGGSDRGFGSQNSGFGSGFTGQSEFLNRGIDEHNHRDIGSSFRHDTEEKRTYGIETLGHEFGSQGFGEKRQHEFERDLESHNHRNIGQDSGFLGSSQGFQSHFGLDNFGSHSSQARSIENFNSRKPDNRFDQNSNGHGTDQSFGSENANVENNKSTDLNSQVNKNKAEFEIISATKQGIHDNHDKENIHMRTPDHDRDKEKNLETENRNTSINNDKVHCNQNTRTKTHNINRQKNIAPERGSNSGVAEHASNSVNNQIADRKTSKENEVTNTPDAGDNIESKEKSDRWIWSGGNETKKEVATTTAAPDLADRAAFDGSKCPTGMIRIGNNCIPVD